MALEVSARVRQVQGTGASRRLRRDGLVPGVVYGGANAPEMIEMVHKDLFQLLKIESFHASLLTLKIEGKEVETVLLRDFQMHPYKTQVYHIDFQRVDPEQEITMKIPLRFINAENAPGVKLAGGVVNHVINEIEIRCLPKDLPESITVDLGGLETGRSVHLSDVVLPEGVKPVLHGVDDPTLAACAGAAEASAGTEEDESGQGEA